MLGLMARNWWAIALRGIAAIVFGIAALVWPGITITVLVIWFGAYVLVDGIFAIVAGFRAAERQMDAWPFFIEGFLGIVIGIITLVWPSITTFALLYLIAAWGVVTGIFEMYAAIASSIEFGHRIALGLAGVLSIIFGLLLFTLPVSGVLALVWLIGVFALLFGISLISLAFRLRGLHKMFGPGPRAGTPA